MVRYALRCRTALIVVATVLLGGIGIPAFATLGEDVASVQNDQARMRASIRMSNTKKYVLHQLQAPNGTVVREYVPLQRQQ